MFYKLAFGEPKFDNDVTKYTVDYILNLDPHGQHLFVFVVDIHYPKKSHDTDFELPIFCDQAIPPNDKVKKLMLTFYEKKIHYIPSYSKILFRKRIKIKKNTLCNIHRAI